PHPIPRTSNLQGLLYAPGHASVALAPGGWPMRRLVLTVQGHSGNWVAFSLTNNSELSVSRYYEHGRILKPRRFFWRPGAHAGYHHESRGHNCPKNDSQDNTAGQSEYDYGRANQCIADNAAKSGRQRPFGVSRPTTRKARRDCYA